MSLTIHVAPSAMANPMPGRRFVVERAPQGHWNLTSAGGRQVIAQADTADELARWARKHGGRVEVL